MSSPVTAHVPREGARESYSWRSMDGHGHGRSTGMTNGNIDRDRDTHSTLLLFLSFYFAALPILGKESCQQFPRIASPIWRAYWGHLGHHIAEDGSSS